MRQASLRRDKTALQWENDSAPLRLATIATGAALTQATKAEAAEHRGHARDA